MLLRRSRRFKAAARAATIAMDEDPAFDPAALVETVVDLFFEREAARQVSDPAAAPLGERFQVARSVPDVRLVGVVNRQGAGEDQVVAHVAYDLQPSEIRRSEYWTLRRVAGRWRLASVEDRFQGRHHLTAPLVAEPAADHLLREDSMLEVGAADPAPAVTAWEELTTDAVRAPAAAVRELGLIDPRFSHAVLESMVRVVADAWMQAAQGAVEELGRIAEPDAIAVLTRPRGAWSRLVVGALELRAMRVVGLDPVERPPTVTVEARFRGIRALRNQGQETLRLGSLRRRTTFRERWTFALQDDPTGWRLCTAAPIGWD